MIEAAPLEFADDGTLYSNRFADVYHSAQGGVIQAREVFLAGNQLPQRWQQQDCFTILETGFGQGLSFLATWQAWLADPQRSQRLHFISVEQFPFTRDDLAILHQRHPEFATLSDELLAHWPHLIAGFHRLTLNGGQVILTLLFGSAHKMLCELVAQVDAIYLDGFSPSKNPDMWSLPVFKQLWRLSKKDTTLATYTAAGAVRRDLNEAGFLVKKVAGFAYKRHMLVGHCARWHGKEIAPSLDKSAIVIGAGMAGCAVAASLAQRGWRVAIFEAENDVAQHASGNPIGLCHPTFSKDDNSQSRLSRAGFAATSQRLQNLVKHNATVQFGFGGQLQIAKDAEQEQLLRDIASQPQWPHALFHYLDADAATAKIGSKPSFGGWWFERALWVNPGSLCNGYIDEGQENINLHTNTPIDNIKWCDGEWHLYSQDQQCIGKSKTLILANATAANTLWPQAQLPISASWRAVSKIEAQAFAKATPTCSGTAYLTPELNGWRCVGACEVDDSTADFTQKNIAKLLDLLPDLKIASSQNSSHRVCARPVSLDRMPLVGPIHNIAACEGKAVHQLFQMPRETGLYAVLGFGSRGLTWHALAAEVIASQLNNEPKAIERSLLNAIDPARFHLRWLRKQSHKD